MKATASGLKRGSETGSSGYASNQQGDRSDIGRLRNIRASTGTGNQTAYLKKSQYDKQLAAYKAQIAAVMAHNGTLANSWDTCVSGPRSNGCGQYLGQNQALPGRPDIAIAGKPTDPAAPVVLPAIPPEVIAYQAVAELKLTAPKPVIGPSPDLNKWKSAVVGYPLWLSVDGSATPPAVSDSVYDVSVSLQARLTKVVFDMGDGSKVTCTQFSHPWSPSVATGAKSPWCGHTYVSVPKGSTTYTVTANAYWSVDWQINGSTGTLPFYQSSSEELPVSELQVLTR
ncbi:MAG: hypothetical protein ACR2LI_07360 [Propionibacteriaceae bacterium]